MISKLKRGILGIVSFLFLLPFAYITTLSFTQNWAFPAVLPTELSLQNWPTVFGAQSDMMYSFGISVTISLLVALFATLAGFFTSKFIAYSPYRRQFMLFSYFPFILSPVIYAVCLYFFFITLNLSGSVTGVIIAQIFVAYPYAVIIFSGFWGDKLKSMENLVMTLGGNTWHIYLRVLLPAASNMLLVCFFQTFLISWFEYGLTSIIGVGKVQTLTIKVFQYITESSIYYAAIAACLLILPPAILLYINKRYVFKTQ